jgi:hypothetical protein
VIPTLTLDRDYGHSRTMWQAGDRQILTYHTTPDRSELCFVTGQPDPGAWMTPDSWLERWSEGRAVLPGDACHTLAPRMAQGAALASDPQASARRGENDTSWLYGYDAWAVALDAVPGQPESVAAVSGS